MMAARPLRAVSSGRCCCGEQGRICQEVNADHALAGRACAHLPQGAYLSTMGLGACLRPGLLEAVLEAAA